MAKLPLTPWRGVLTIGLASAPGGFADGFVARPCDGRILISLLFFPQVSPCYLFHRKFRQVYGRPKFSMKIFPPMYGTAYLYKSGSDYQLQKPAPRFMPGHQELSCRHKSCIQECLPPYSAPTIFYNSFQKFA